MEIYILHTFITFKKHCIYQHFKPFYFSRLFIAGIVSMSLSESLCYSANPYISTASHDPVITYFYLTLYKSPHDWYKIGTGLVQARTNANNALIQ